MSESTTQPVDLKLWVSDDGLRAFAGGRLPSEGAAAFAEAVASLARERGIRAALAAAELTPLVAAAASPDGRVEGLVIAQGSAAEPSRDGEVVWKRDFFAGGFVEDESGGVDFWERRANPSVARDELIAVVREARKGQDGRDVYGNKLPARNPERARVRAGANVRAQANAEGDTELYAGVDGRVRLASGVVAVDNVYTIAGNVGLETGHIHHKGAVVVKGDVEAGSEIEAGGDLEVKGTVESARLVVGGDLVVSGGIVGTGREPIVVGGRVRAKFILDAEIEAGEGVEAESEITHSVIRTRGAVEIPRGRIVTGQVTALGAVTAGVVGGEGLSRTSIAAGVDHKWETEYVARAEEVKRLEKNIARIRETVSPLLAREKSLTPQQREAATELLARSSLMEGQVKELQAAVSAFETDHDARVNPRIVVKVRGHADVLLRVGDLQLTLESLREGPFRVRPVRGKLMALPGENDTGGEGEQAGEAAAPPAASPA